MKHLLLFLFFAAFALKATHLTQARFSYTYLGTNYDSLKRYNIRLTFNKDCKPGSITIADELSLGIYYAKNGMLLKSVKAKLVSKRAELNCFNICQSEYIFETSTGLPADTEGYFITNQTCCRIESNSFRNDQSGMPDIGYTVFCFIPGKINNNNIQMSRNVFYTDPSRIDTIPLTISDPDKDSVVVTFTAPSVGASSAQNYPDPSSKFEQRMTVSPANYMAGFSTIYPLGVAGICKIENGNLILKSTREGPYFIAFDIKEYRKGQLVGHTIWETIVFSTLTGPSSNKYSLSGWGAPEPKAILNWNYCRSDLSSQVVEKSTDGKNFTGLETVGPEVREHYDADVTWNTMYYYRIKGIKSGNASIYSDTAIVRFWGAGVSDNRLDANIRLSPVPISGVCHVQSENSDITACTVIDQLGRQMSYVALKSAQSELDIDCSVLQPGIYFIQLTTANGEIVNKRVVKI